MKNLTNTEWTIQAVIKDPGDVIVCSCPGEIPPPPPPFWYIYIQCPDHI